MTTPDLTDSELSDAADSSEPALLARSRAGDRQAFEELVRRTARLVYARAYLETGDVHRAEDLVQETYLRAWRRLGQLNDAAGFRAWLLAILHSALLDSVRRESRKKRKSAGFGGETSDMLTLADARPTPAQSAESDEQRRRALSVLRDLPPAYREVLSLRYLAGADYDQIARQLALSNGSLRGLLHRGLAMMRKRFDADADADADRE